MDLRLDILRDRQAEEAALVEIDQMEIDRVSDLRERGLLPASAELSALRALRVSNAQSLDTTSEIVEIEIEAARMAAEVAEQGAEQRLDLLTELEARLAEVALDRAQLDTIAAQLSAFDTMLEVAEESTTYVLHRGVGDDAVQREVGPDEPLLPGDVVEVIAGRVGASETTSP
jgi:polysaccharide export outer membrane protein/exopolysaccharide production protein ExoF